MFAGDFRVEHKKYSNNKVQSAMVTFPDGTKKSIGCMEIGTHEFISGTEETIEIEDGVVEVFIESQTPFKARSGDIFVIPPKTKFLLSVYQGVKYICSYL